MKLSKRQGPEESPSHSHSPTPTYPSTPKTNLNHIIEVTEEQQSNPHPSQSPKDTTPTETPQQSNTSKLKRYFTCCANWWRFLCRSSSSRLQLDVGDSDFTQVISKLKKKKSYYAPVLPPLKESRKTLVLDLDQTLIHTSFTKPAKYDYQSQVIFNGKATRIYTIKRFGLEAFLFQMSKLYEIVVFTASQKLYADKILDQVDPKNRISHRLYRQHCIVINKTYYLKNLKILGRELTHTIIVDDNNTAGLLHPLNFYRIEQFDGNQKDRHLCRLSAFLKHISNKKQILPVGDLRKRFQEMEINLEQASFLEPSKQQRSMEARMRKYNHRKTNSEVQTLIKDEKSDQGQAQTTTSCIIKKL